MRVRRWTVEHGRSKCRTDRGAVQAPAAAAIATAGLLAIPLLFGTAVLTAGDDTNGCGTQVAAQPDAAPSAKSDIPATYLRLYQTAGRQYWVPWNLLAAIGKVESDHGRDPGPGVPSGANHAGTAGPMQIGIGGAATNNWGGAPRHPATRNTGGVGTDGNDDGWANVHDPADAIPGAARYLLAHGAPHDLAKAVFAYNHSTGYVRKVLDQATHYATGNPQHVADTGAADSCPGDVAAYGTLPGDVVAKVIAYARAQIGKPYVYGAEGPDTFDCSGLTMRAYQAAGITIPRTSQTQYHLGRHIPQGTEQPGDLVFFAGTEGTAANPGHVGLVIGAERMIEARCTTCGPINTASYHGRNPVGFTRPTAHQTR
ncbi:hydrolase [Actinomadura darangshiensis]|uniref:Hydrolase n=1 Tax=Actinomadura darangshiensis TaxID=705336 RepID=A0A4R4ZQT2_9ACTN|nr:NlpC/P60 family protein [Actinomadura darangshiensis]TDD61321.1 hydrolase [Actinomadura darangshiensis]